MAQSNTRLTISLQYISQAASLAVCAIGCLVMLGWILDIPALKSVFPGLVTMKTNAALGFILSGAALWLWHKEGKSEKHPQAEFSFASPDFGARQQQVNRNNFFILPFALCILPFIISLLTLIEYQFDVDFGIDQLLFKEPANAIVTLAPNRMAPNTALDFLLLSSAMLLMQRRGCRYRVAQLLSLVAFLVAWLGFLGYIYNIKEFYGIATYTRMALHTTIAFILLSIGILFACPDKGLMSVAIANSAGGIMAHRLSLAVVVIPPLLSWIILTGYRQQQYDSDFGLAIAVVMNLVVFSILIWWNANSLNVIDERRQKAEEELRSLNAELEQRAILNSANYSIISTNVDGTILTFNRAAERWLGYAAEEVVGKTTPALFHDKDKIAKRAQELSQELGVTIEPGFEVFVAKARQGEPDERQWTYIRKDGSRFPILLSVTAVRDGEGNIKGFMGIATDISDAYGELRLRIEAEKALRDSERRFRAIFNQTFQFMGLLNPDGTILEVNQPALEVGGLKHSDVVGRRVWDAGWKFTPEDRQLWLSAIPEAAQGKFARFEVHLPFGEDINLTIDASVKPVKDETGQVVFLIVEGRDISERKRAEEALYKSQQQLQAILDNSPAVIYLIDIQNRYLLINRKFQNLFNRNREQIIGKSIRDIWARNIADEWENNNRQVIETNTPLETEEIVLQDNELHTYLSIKFLLYDSSGVPYAVCGISTDITERKQAEEALRKAHNELEIRVQERTAALAQVNNELRTEIVERVLTEQALRQSEERYRSLVVATAQNVWTTDPSGLVVSNLPLWRAITGQTEAEIQGWGWLEALHPDDREQTAQLWMQAIETKSLYETEYRVRLHDGSYGYFLCRGVPVLEPDGSIREWVGIHRDITERKQAEEALQKSEARFRHVVDSNMMGIIFWDVNGNITEANDAFLKMVGYTQEDLVSDKMRWKDMTPVEYNHLDEKGIEEIAATGVCTPFEKEYIRKDGSRVPVLVGGAMLEGYEDRGVCFVIDISDRKRMEYELAEQAKELARSNADLAQFAYVASHDLQEPLRMVASYTQLLSRRYKGKLDEDADEFIAFAVDGANRMQKLIKDLLEYSRIGTRGQQFAPVECESVFEDAIANLQIAIEESGAIVERDLLPTVWGDSTQLGQLLQNLIGNAIKFCGNPPPRIHVSAQKGENEWIFSVRDNGIGIEPDQRDRIFVIFQRLHSRAEYPGTGIGLAICKKIVERHGGQIWVQSQPGQGSVFHFTIPLTGVDVN